MKLKFTQILRIVLVLSTFICGISFAADILSVEQSVQAGRKFLAGRISPSGKIFGELADTSDSEYGLGTLQVISALMQSGLRPADSAGLKRAINFAAGENFTSVSARAWRIIAFEKIPGSAAGSLIEADAKWLISAACKNGGWGWQGGPSQQPNNLATAWVTKALWIASRRGVSIEPEIWKKALDYWLNQQSDEGGWAFTKFRGRTKRQANPYGSITVRGILSVWRCYCGYSLGENLPSGNATLIRVNNAIEAARQWLDRNFDLESNPGKAMEWYYDYLAELESLAAEMGYRQFRGRLFSPLVSRMVRQRQNSNGSWGLGNDLIEPTCGAMGALTGTTGKMFINKLQFAGRWNLRPNDAKNLLNWLDDKYELKLQWQVVSLRDGPTRFSEVGRLMYISGEGRVKFNDDDAAKLRDFIDRGGMVVSEAVNGDRSFALSIRRLMQKVLPSYRPQRITDDCPLTNIQFKIPTPKGWILGNGARVQFVLLTKDVSRTFELKNEITGRWAYEFFANVLQYMTNKRGGDITPLRPGPAKIAKMPKKHVDLARIKFAGNYNPEPYAMDYFNNHMMRKYSLRLFVDNFCTLDKLDAAAMPAAYLAGTGEFPAVGSRELLTLQKYLVDGGTLIVEAVGGDKAFAETVRLNLLDKIGKLRENNLKITVKSRKNEALRNIRIGGRVAVVFSPVDFHESIIGMNYSGLNGFNSKATDVLGDIFMGVLKIK